MTGTETKELQQLKNRLLELADKSYNRGVYTFTPFLDLTEQQVFHRIAKDVAYAGTGMEGGAPVCDRKMIRFGSPENFGYEEDYPIACVEIKPAMPKFADRLTHRDFLGAAMNLGIERDTIGDIFVQENSGILFCKESIAPYLMENLNQVKHTSVICRISDRGIPLQGAQPKEVSVTVSSARIDSVVAKLYDISRSGSLALFRAGKVFVNGIVTENNSYQLREEDAVTVRGYGKFLYYGQTGGTRKGRERISVGVFG